MSQSPRLSDDLAALELRLTQSAAQTQQLDTELARFGETALYSGREVARLSQSLSTGLRRSFDAVIFDGVKLSEALKGLAQSMAGSLYGTATKPVFDAAGGALTQGLNLALSQLLPFAQGGAFIGGKVTPFAKGGVVASATTFPMRGGTGLMGEAGPEAIMPLARAADGSLGVRASAKATATPHVTIHISTPDAQSFRRSEAQIAAQMSRALARGNKNR